MNDRTIRQLMEDYADDIVSTHERGADIDMATLNKLCRAAILARLKAKMPKIVEDTAQTADTGPVYIIPIGEGFLIGNERDGKVYNAAIDQALKVLESELTNGK